MVFVVNSDWLKPECKTNTEFEAKYHITAPNNNGNADTGCSVGSSAFEVVLF